MKPPSPPAASEASTVTAAIDPVLHALGFEYGDLSPQKVSGHLVVTETCCQSFGALHGGVSAVVAESLASVGAHMASGFQRVAGVNLCINHLRPARLGDRVLAEARPAQLGNTIQVWDVEIWTEEGRTPPPPAAAAAEKRNLVSTSRVTLLCNLPVPDGLKSVSDPVKKYAKL